MTPEEKAVLDAAVHWFHFGCDADRVDAAVAKLIEARKPKPKWSVHSYANVTKVIAEGESVISIANEDERLALRISRLLNEDEDR